MKTKEEIAQYKKEWAEKNKEKIKQRLADYYSDNKELIKNRSNVRYSNFKDEIRVKRREYYEENKIEYNRISREYAINHKKEITEYRNEYDEINKDKLKKMYAEYYIKNKEKLSMGNKKYRLANKEKIDQYNQKNKEKKKEYNSEYKRNRKVNDDLYRLTVSIRCIINGALKRGGYPKISKTTNILGCAFDELKFHLESRFEPWMNWNNRGNWNGEPKKINTAWDIDHIIPLSSAKTEEELIKLNHYTNLQPLCSFTNRHIKRDVINFSKLNSIYIEECQVS